MKPRSLPDRCSRALDGVIRGIEAWSESAVPGADGYSGPAVRRRLAQALADATYAPFLAEGVRRWEKSERSLPSDDVPMRLAGLVFEGGSVGATPGLLARSAAVFFFHWLYVLAAYLGGALVPAARKRAATILCSVGAADLHAGGSDARFAEFCRRGPVLPLRSAEWILVEAVQAPRATDPSRLEYARRALPALHRLGPNGWGETPRFLIGHMRALAAFARLVARCPCACLLGKDFAYHALAASLDRRGLIGTLLISNSDYHRQLLWMTDLPGRRFKTFMVWYSTNNRPLQYKGEAEPADLPQYRHLRVDESLVWSEGHERQLRAMGVQGAMRAVGPILWYLPPREAAAAINLRVAVFDVTPMDPEWAKANGYAHYWYTADRVRSFIEGVLAACAELEAATGQRVVAALKPKRKSLSIHDKGYLSFLREASAPGGRLELVAPETSQYEFLHSCRLAVVIPFSSPAYVAGASGVPCAYFDPMAELEPRYAEAPGVEFVAGRPALSAWMRARLPAGSLG